jgi:hypothetical protein
MEAHVQVEPVLNWEVGSAGEYGGTGKLGSFIAATMSPQEVRRYIPLVKNLGEG